MRPGHGGETTGNNVKLRRSILPGQGALDSVSGEEISFLSDSQRITKDTYSPYMNDHIALTTTAQPRVSAHAIAIDGGCSSTIVTDRSLMLDLTPHVENIGTANSDAPPLHSVAYGRAQIPLGSQFCIVQRALYCPKAPCNLLAPNDLEKVGLYFVSANSRPGQILVASGNSPCSTDELLLTCEKRFGLHFLPSSASSIAASLALIANKHSKLFKNVNDLSELECEAARSRKLLDYAVLLHNRFGHASYQRLRHVIYHSTTADLPHRRLPSTVPACETCVKATRKAASFPKVSAARNFPPGGMLHMDVAELKPLFRFKYRYLLLGFKTGVKGYGIGGGDQNH
jgi:hypothetical protein